MTIDAESEEYIQVLIYQDEGHTHHCACRMVWGGGECECNLNKQTPEMFKAVECENKIYWLVNK